MKGKSDKRKVNGGISETKKASKYDGEKAGKRVQYRKKRTKRQRKRKEDDEK